MPTFTQTTFVRVEDPVQREELCGWLEAIGYEFGYGAYDDNYPIVISYSHINQYLYSEEGPSRNVSIDCGTNTAMFCAIAAIQEDSDYRQWFVSPGGCWRICSCRSWSDDRRLSAVWHKATPTEIVEHFKIKES